MATSVHRAYRCRSPNRALYRPPLVVPACSVIALQSADPLEQSRAKGAHGWIETRPVKRRRKNGHIWEGVQSFFCYYCQTEKRTRQVYLRRRQLAGVIASIHDGKSIQETLKILGK